MLPPSRGWDHNEATTVSVSADLVTKVEPLATLFWKGTSGKPDDMGSPPPDITLYCYDDDKLLAPGEEEDPLQEKAPPVELVISWNLSWSDVLDLLRNQFGRAVVFEYKYREGTTVVVLEQLVADEREFDIFCERCEKGLCYINPSKYDPDSTNLFAEAKIVNATMRPSEWIWSPPAHRQLYPHNLSGVPADLEGLDVNIPSGHRAHDESLLLENKTESATLVGRVIASLSRALNDAPVPPEQMAMFGGGGLLLSCAVVVYLYLFEGIYSVAAVTLSLPCNIFLNSLLICEVEEGFGALFKMGVAFCGFWASGCICFPCLMIAQVA
jgi:hypothetical protein